MATMRAALCRAYGPPHVVRIEEVERPEPKSNEVLIRIRATTVSSADWRARTLTVPRGMGMFVRPVFGLIRPRQPILGTELAGEIVGLGRDVTTFSIGDAVVAYPAFPNGCHAEYRTMRADGRIILKPDRLSFEEAAAMCFGGVTALHFLRDRAKLAAGERRAGDRRIGGAGQRRGADRKVHGNACHRRVQHGQCRPCARDRRRSRDRLHARRLSPRRRNLRRRVRCRGRR